MPITTLDPHTALVVIDLQAGIVAAPVTPIPSADVVARTAWLADAFRAQGLPVVLVHVTTSPDGADAVPGRTDAGSRGSGARPANFSDLVPELGDGIVVTKRNWGAFYGTDLDLQLRRRGITQVVLTGIATSIGVESTARAAHEHGYNVTVATDAVSDLDEATHRNSVERIFPRLAETGTTAEILEVLTKR
ncbi:isochorismatase family protein [Actinoplanes solisilvae]|uniref:isochorismatase family protein n=1 Tax=Actinoplanes solisilvae TaxID=2486853 RepID=UPI000FDAA921|nr:isochorismatase family protein [Actinoplanes solisilvae]